MENEYFKEILGRIPRWRKFYYGLLQRWYMLRPEWLSKKWPRCRSLLLLTLYGFTPVMYFHFIEDIFVFKTEEEAYEAFMKLENADRALICAYWYGKEDFEREYKTWRVEYQLTKQPVLINSWEDFKKVWNYD